MEVKKNTGNTEVSKTIVHKSSHYVNNKELYEEIKRHWAEKKETGEKPRISEYVGDCLLKIAQKLASRYNFAGYTYRDEFVSDAYTGMIGAFWKFDPKKSEVPFLYFTQVAWNQMVRRIGEEKKQTYIKHAVMENDFISSVSDMYEEAHHTVKTSPRAENQKAGIEHHYDVLRNWEETRARKKAKKPTRRKPAVKAKKKLTRKAG